MLNETLSVTITGDSTDLQSEISQVQQQLQDLQQTIANVNNSGSQIASSLSNVSQALAPLQQVSQMLTQTSSQIQQISATPITLDVSQAMTSLQQLIDMAQQTAAEIQSISGAAAGGGGGLTSVGESGGAGMMSLGDSGSGFGGDTGGVTYMASGGPVVGPTGIDRVPTMLTAGEFVLNQQTSASLGADFLNALNRSGIKALSGQTNDARPAANFPASASSSTTNHFGGINIQVTQAGEVDSLIRDLRLQGIQLRNRRG